MQLLKMLATAIVFVALTSFNTKDVPKAFTDLLATSNMTFEQPSNLEATKTIENGQMNYEYAIKHPTKKFEIRYAIRPLNQLLKDYTEREKNKKPGDTNIDPNTLYKSLLQVTVLNISGGQLPTIGEFGKQAVKQEFNADWGATTVVPVGKEFGQQYKYCMVVALHKHNVADAYIFYLSDTKDGFMEAIKPTFHALKFK